MNAMRRRGVTGLNPVIALALTVKVDRGEE